MLRINKYIFFVQENNSLYMYADLSIVLLDFSSVPKLGFSFNFKMPGMLLKTLHTLF